MSGISAGDACIEMSEILAGSLTVWLELASAFNGRPTDESVALIDAPWLDGVDFSPAEVCLALHAGVCDMTSGLAGLFASWPSFPSARAAFPLVRSIQEGSGRVLWVLCVKEILTGVMAPRLERARIEQEQYELDNLSAANPNGQYQRASRLPVFSTFAALAQEMAFLSQGQTSHRDYHRHSLDAHGGLWGVLQSSEQNDDRRELVSDPMTLVIAGHRASAYWRVASGCLASYLGWEITSLKLLDTEVDQRFGMLLNASS